jgi:hypothetical protein
MNDFWVTITNDERGEIWERVFGTRTMAVKSPLTKLGTFPGHEEPQAFYELDLTCLSAEQRESLIEYICSTFRLGKDHVERLLDDISVPILSADCFVTANLLRGRSPLTFRKQK